MLAIITIMGSVPTEVVAKALPIATAGSLLEESENSNANNKKSKTEIILESAKERPEKEQEKTEKPKTEESTQNIVGQPETSPVQENQAQPMPLDVQKIPNPVQGDILRELIMNTNPGMMTQEIAPVTLEENLIPNSQIYSLEEQQIENNILTTKVEYQIGKDENNKPTHITWVFKTKTTHPTQQKINYTTIQNQGLSAPLKIEAERNLNKINDPELNPYTDLTYQDIINQIENIGKNNQTSELQTIQETQTNNPEEITQTIIKTPITREQDTYSIIITTQTQTTNGPITKTKVYTITKDGQKLETVAQATGERRKGTINWKRVDINNTSATQTKTIDITPDNNQAQASPVRITTYELTEEDYREKVQDNKEEIKIEPSAPKTNQKETISKIQINEEETMRTYGIFKTAKDIVEKQQDKETVQTNQDTEQAKETIIIEENKQEAPQKEVETEEIPQIVLDKTALTTPATMLGAVLPTLNTVATENVTEAVNATEETQPQAQSEAITIEGSAQPEEAQAVPTEVAEPTEETRAIISRLEELETAHQTNTETTKTINQDPNEIVITEIETTITNPSEKYTIPGAELRVSRNLVAYGEDYEDLRRRTVPDGDLKLAIASVN